jgi:hypothetical protein
MLGIFVRNLILGYLNSNLIVTYKLSGLFSNAIPWVLTRILIPYRLQKRYLKILLIVFQCNSLGSYKNLDTIPRCITSCCCCCCIL